MVGLQAIKSVYTSSNTSTITQLLPSPILAFVDSTIPGILLPPEACNAFEQQFGLQYNSTIDKYTLTDEQHNFLAKSNPNITFTLANSKDGGPTVDIVLPYLSFDLLLKPPFAPSNTRYFPIIPAANESQYALGRTFLQEAYDYQPLLILLLGVLRLPRYLSVNYEHSNFSISQCTFEDGVQENTVAIPSGSKQSQTTRNYKAIVGGPLGAAVPLLLVLSIVLLMRHKRQRRWNDSNPKPLAPLSPLISRRWTQGMSLNEIGRNSTAEMRSLSPEIDGTALAEMAQKSKSSFPSQSRCDKTRPSRKTCTEVTSRSSRPASASKQSEKSTRYRSKQNRHGRIYDSRLSPPANFPEPQESILDRPLPPLPRDSTLSIIQSYTGHDGRLDEVDEKLIWEHIENRVRTGTPF